MEHPAVNDYLGSADRRIRIGARFILELYKIPLPNSLARGMPGRTIRAKDLPDMADRWTGSGQKPVKYRPPAKSN
jgi:hypothetical protein